MFEAGLEWALHQYENTAADFSDGLPLALAEAAGHRPLHGLLPTAAQALDERMAARRPVMPVAWARTPSSARISPQGKTMAVCAC